MSSVLSFSPPLFSSIPSLLPFIFLLQKNLLFSEFNFSAVCVGKNEFVQARILTLGADLHFAYGGSTEYVALASKVIFWEHLRKSWSFPNVYSYTVSMACDSVLSLKTALQNCGMYSFIVKEEKLWLQPYPQVWCSLLFSFVSPKGLSPFLNTNSGSY